MVWIGLIVTAVVGLGGLWVKILDYRLNKKEKENDSLKDTVANVNTQVNIIIANSNAFNQLPEDLQKILVSVQASTAVTDVITPKQMPDSGNIDSDNNKE